MDLSPVRKRLRTAIASTGAPLLAVLCCTVPDPPVAQAQFDALMTHAQLRQVVRDAMAEKLVWMSDLAIHYDKDALRFDLGSVEIPVDELPGELWPLAFPLRAQFQVERIRKYESKPEQQRAWQPYLVRVEQVIDKELTLIDRYRSGREPKQEEDDLARDKLYEQLLGYEAYTNRILIWHLDSVADSRGQIAISIRESELGMKKPRRFSRLRQGKLVVEVHDVLGGGPKALEEVHYCTVRITTDPGGASVYYLPEFEYRLKDQAGLAADPDNWREAAADTVKLCGNYRFLARWSGSGKSKRTGKVSIIKDETLVLRP
jgi:hypothetical protein